MTFSKSVLHFLFPLVKLILYFSKYFYLSVARNLTEFFMHPLSTSTNYTGTSNCEIILWTHIPNYDKYCIKVNCWCFIYCVRDSYEDLRYTTGLGFCFLLLVTITSSLDYLHFSMTSQYFIFNLHNISNSGYPWLLI